MTNFNTTTTLNEIRSCSPCEEGWRKLLKHLDKTEADDEPLELLTILNSNGLDDAAWCLRVPSLERLSRHFQAAIAERVLPLFESKYPDDMSVRDQIAVLRNDSATNDEREAARGAADVAGWAARAAAREAAWAAAREAAWAAAQASEREAQEAILRKMIGEK